MARALEATRPLAEWPELTPARDELAEVLAVILHLVAGLAESEGPGGTGRAGHPRAERGRAWPRQIDGWARFARPELTMVSLTDRTARSQAWACRARYLWPPSAPSCSSSSRLGPGGFGRAATMARAREVAHL